MVTWIIGLSGSGKTTLAEQVLLDIKKRGSSAVIVDGDVARELWGNDLGYDIDSRRENAQRICRLCQFLDQQGLDVVCAILSIFPESGVVPPKSFFLLRGLYRRTTITSNEERC